MVSEANEGVGNNQNQLTNLIKDTLHPKHKQKIVPVGRSKKNSKATENATKEPVVLIYDELREALCVTRDFAVKGLFTANIPNELFPEEYINLATSYRNAMVKILNCTRNDIHCTVKYCSSEKKVRKRRKKLWTFARSNERSGRSMVIGPEKTIPIYQCSSFSSIIGCKDAKGNNWISHRNQCFSCNDLTSVPNCADGKKHWDGFYKSSVVFPIRYEVLRKGVPTDYIMGFLTFDSPIKNVFEKVPSRFDFIGEPEAYIVETRKTDVYHVGHSIADVLAMATILSGAFKEKEAGVVSIQGDY